MCIQINRPNVLSVVNRASYSRRGPGIPPSTKSPVHETLVLKLSGCSNKIMFSVGLCFKFCIYM